MASTTVANTGTANTSTTTEGTGGTTAAEGARSIGTRIDTLIATAERQPLVAVGIGIVVGYLLARILDR